MSSQHQILLAINPSILQALQAFTVTIAAGATTGTATISSADTTKSAVFYGGLTGPHTTITCHTDMAHLVQTNATTITATRNTSDASNALTVNGTIITFVASAITSIQIGTITLSGTANGTISAVTLTNSICAFNGLTTTVTSNNLSTTLAMTQLASSTTVTSTKATSVASTTTAFTVIEFSSNALNSSTQQSSISFATASATATLTSTATAQTMLTWGGFNSTGTGAWDIPWLTLTNATTATAARGGTAGTVIVYFSAAEFNSSKIRSINRGSIVIPTSATTNTATITAVNTAKTLPNYLGSDNAAGTSALGKAIARLDLTNSTTLTATDGTADVTNTVTLGYDSIEFI